MTKRHASFSTAPIVTAVPSEETRGEVRPLKGARQQKFSSLAPDHDSYSVSAFSDVIDRATHAAAARLTFGLSPAAMIEAYVDWVIHLTFSPGKQLQLGDKAFRKMLRFANYVSRCSTQRDNVGPCIEPLPQDKRFAGEEWQRWPFNIVHQAFLLQQQWWHNATTDIRGVTRQHEDIVSFVARQWLDMVAPSNFLLTNPKALQITFETGGANLVRGFQNFMQDWERAATGRRPIGAENFQPGKGVAVTSGKVIYRNRLIELIQYAPTTDMVRPEPILIIPAWIMKYYILDLSPNNSMVKHLVEQGFTVFMISWKNPGPEDRDLDLEDYRREGIMAALNCVNAVCPERNVHTVGYCLGGTLLAIAAAAMARDDDTRLQTMTLLAAQTDFTEAGELMLFINESQLSFLEDMMWEQGFLDARQMAGAFQMLRSNDMIWSRLTRHYLLGERTPMNDLMAWNADATRMPYRMHSQYLRNLFFNNDLAEGRFAAAGSPIALSDIRVPIFAVGTLQDHVAPWRSTYKLNLLTGSDVTYVLASGGHNVGIVAPPDEMGRNFQVMHRRHDEPYVDPEAYGERAQQKPGSWWPEWFAWLGAQSGKMIPPPAMGMPGQHLRALPDAPGRYVLQD
ncbi:MAG: PHA/PHB synthase family protein [Variibacter sp.]